MKEWFTAIMARLEHSRFAPLLQFVKFGLVGVSNTLINYAVDMLCYYVLLRPLPLSEQARIICSSAIAFIISTTNAFILNSRFVFKAEGPQSKSSLFKTYLRTVACYALTGLLLAPAIKVWLTNAGIPFWATSLLSLIVTIPLNFLMNKFWAFTGRK